MPKPRFRDYDKEDQFGKDFSYRTKDQHTPQPGMENVSTLKPTGFAPRLYSKNHWHHEYEFYNNMPSMRKWGKYRRLSKNQRNSWRSVKFPVFRKFSTFNAGEFIS